VVGESGLGKTTFLHTLLRKYVSVYFVDPTDLLQKTVNIVEVGQFLVFDSAKRPALV
jgi:septin family protein